MIMGQAILQLVPVMIAAAVTPFCIILVLMLLRSPDAVGKALAFAGGQILVRLVQGLGLGSELGFSTVAQTKQGAAGIINTLVLVAGILLLVKALKGWFKPAAPEVAPPAWMRRVDSVSRLQAFALGLVTVAGGGKQWVFTFYALGVLRMAELSPAQYALAFLVFILGAQALILLPIGLYAVSPKRSSRVLAVCTAWLERHTQTIVSVVSTVFGTFFLLKGIVGLLG